ncbi:MAG TPA: type 4a pilus biogenesis protein PilO [Thermoanaerobaculia bacterium]|nr:type 4a pilus biogenesis protein PilO [Thermoanaerobaculia bacterium]
MPLETALEGKPVYWGLGIGLVLAALCLAGTQYMWINDINASIATTNAELDELQKKIENGRAAEKKLPQFREEVARLELELEKLRRILPSSKNTEEIIKKIKSLVDQGDFALRSMVFPKLKTSGEGGEPFVEWPIQIVVDGSYHNLAILFNRLSNFSRIMNVEQFNITALSTQQDRTISADFIAKTFVYVEPKEPEPDATKKAKPGGAKAGGGE